MKLPIRIIVSTLFWKRDHEPDWVGCRENVEGGRSVLVRLILLSLYLRINSQSNTLTTANTRTTSMITTLTTSNQHDHLPHHGGVKRLAALTHSRAWSSHLFHHFRFVTWL